MRKSEEHTMKLKQLEGLVRDKDMEIERLKNRIDEADKQKTQLR